jgi:hypothetical protein
LTTGLFVPIFVIHEKEWNMRGRKPIGVIAMTSAERQRRHKQKQQAELISLRNEIQALKSPLANEIPAPPKAERVAAAEVDDSIASILKNTVRDAEASYKEDKAKAAAEAEANAKANAEREESLRNMLNSYRAMAKDNKAKVEAAGDAVLADLAADGLDVEMLKGVARHLNR